MLLNYDLSALRRRVTARHLVAVLAISLLPGCGDKQRSAASEQTTTGSLPASVAMAASACDSGWAQELLHTASRKGQAAVPRELLHARPQHAAGDVVRLDIVEGQEFSGTYKVNLDGYVTFPYANSIRAAGLTTPQLMEAIKAAFIDKGLLRPERADLSVIPVEWAPVQVRVTGAVFRPGRGLINNPEKGVAQAMVPPVGDSPPGRFLDAGLRIAAGVRPDADMSRIIVHRKGRKYTVDLSGIVEGTPVPDIYLMHGDHIEVPSTGCNQAALMRPSQVTPPGIRIFISTLAVPITGNPEEYTANIPYGTRLLAAAISGNCVGGTHLTNAGRRIAHVSNDPILGKVTVREIPVREMLAHPNDFGINPYVMPNDAIACFDSEITNVRDVVRHINEILSTVGLAIALF